MAIDRKIKLVAGQIWRAPLGSEIEITGKDEDGEFFSVHHISPYHDIHVLIKHDKLMECLEKFEMKLIGNKIFN